MKTTVLAENMILCIENLKSAREYAKSLANAENIDDRVKKSFVNIVTSLNIRLSEINSCIKQKDLQDWREQVKEPDALAMEGIKHLFVNMTAAQRVLFEETGQAIIDGNIRFEE